MAGSEMLFACTKCHSRHKFEDLSKEEQLCKDCRRKYPLVNCHYCQLEFHILKKVKGVPVCGKCSHNQKTYGEPKACKYCMIKAAFKDKSCARCTSSEKKYGAPKKCQRCSLMSAFQKNKESQEKVNGKLLCLRCTLQFKKDKHKVQKQQRKDQKSKTDSRSSLGSNPVLAPLKAENITKSLYKSGLDSIDHTRRSTTARTENNNSIEPTFGDHMTELTSLREQIIQLKRTIAQKDKIILEKDKKISELQADQWEKEKLLRTKTQNLQKQYEDRIQNIHMENTNLKKQVSQLSKVKKTPKLERVSSRIRLEAYKISITPTSGQSPEHKSSNHTEESNTEAENTADENTADEQEKPTEQEKNTSQIDDKMVPAENEMDEGDKEEDSPVKEQDDSVRKDNDEDKDEEDAGLSFDLEDKSDHSEDEDQVKPDGSSHDDNDDDDANHSTDATKSLQSFDEAQADGIKRILSEDNAEEGESQQQTHDSDGDETSSKAHKSSRKRRNSGGGSSKKRKHKRSKDKKDASGNEEEEGGSGRKRKKKRKSKAIVFSDPEDDSDAELVKVVDPNDSSDADDDDKMTIDESQPNTGSGGGIESSDDE